ncbi:MAG TPA: ROK family protein [Aeromicrobium sp.]|nr:ROK family protein [Aeromicrobium sp.]HKY58514.1 ROK family protein [Aeromicrobium sp.]
MTNGLAVGIDIGGTKMAAGVVDPEGKVLARREVPTPVSDRWSLLDAIIAIARDLAAAHPVDAVGVGVAGLVDRAGEVVRIAAHLPLQDEPLRDEVAAALELPVVVDNDANAGGWAEARFGAARGAENAVFVAVGTGIGGAIIIDGGLRRGWQGAAGEIGHLIVERDGRPCPCGSRGCWEQYGSGRALVRAATEAGLDVPHGAAVTAAAAAGDERALGVFGEIGGWVGVGIAGLVAVLDPEVVVVGGGVSAAGDLLLEPARDSFRAHLTARSSRPEPPVLRAALGPDAGLIGAADLARVSLH